MAKIIHVVGTSGSGKSTVLEMLRRSIEEEGYSVETIKEPGPLRSLAKSYRSESPENRNPFVEAAIFAVDRFITYKTVVAPKIDNDNLVFLFDRGLPDSVVYQGIMGGVDVNSILNMNSSIPKSDLYLCLVVDGKTGHGRINERKLANGEPITYDEIPERINQLSEAYKRVAKQYFANMHVIDTTDMSVGMVFNRCIAHVSATLNKLFAVKGIEAVGFDVDNTLYKNTSELYAITQNQIIHLASQEKGGNYEETKQEFYKYFNELQSASKSLSKMGIDRSKAQAIVQRALETTDLTPVLHKNEKLSSLMRSLAERYKLFIITGGSPDFTRKKLSALGIEDHESLFKLQLYSDSQYRREDGSAFEYVSEQLSVPFGKMMFIGDREAVDIIPAKRLGLVTAIVNNSSKEADYSLDEIYALEHILLRRTSL